MQWQTLESEVAYCCDGFDVITEQVELPNGTRTDFDYLHEDESVVILPFTAGGDVVVIDEWRHAVRRVNRGLPAGTLESGEQPAEAVERELREETGYDAGSFQHLTTVEPANGFSNAVFHYYVAHDCEHAGEQHLDHNETIKPTTTQFEALVEATREGELRDGRSAFGVLYYLAFER